MQHCVILVYMQLHAILLLHATTCNYVLLLAKLAVMDFLNLVTLEIFAEWLKFLLIKWQNLALKNQVLKKKMQRDFFM